MAASNVIVKWATADSGGTGNTQPHQHKSTIKSITGWQLLDRVNNIKAITFSMPADEIEDANAFIERNIQLPFIDRFDGIITDRTRPAEEITLTAKEHAFHFTRRILRNHGNQSRIIYTNENWYNASWKFRQKVMVEGQHVLDDLLNYPLLITRTDLDFKRHARFDGNDFLVTAKDGITKLSHEVVYWDKNTGKLELWVKVPKVSSVSDTFVYVYYGNPSATNQQDVVNTWETNYKGVWHLHQDPTSTPPEYKDSTSNVNDGTETDVTRVLSTLGFAGSFNGTTSKVDCASGASIDDLFAAGGTLKAVFNPTNAGEGSAGIVVGKIAWLLNVQDLASNMLKLRFVHNFSGTNGIWTTMNTVVPTNGTSYVKVYYNRDSVANDPVIYVNGVVVPITETQTPVGTASTDVADNLIIGNNTGQTATFNGYIDDIQLWNDVLTANRALIDYYMYSVFDGFVFWFPPEEYQKGVNSIVQDILDSANNDMPALEEQYIEGQNHYWAMDDDSKDSIGTDHGTITGVIQYAVGKCKLGFDFDAATRIAVPHSSALNQQSASYSYGLTFIPDTRGADRVWMMKKDPASTPVPYKIMQTSTNIIRAVFADASTTKTLDSTSVIVIGQTMNIWININRTTNKAELWINGIKEDEEDITGMGTPDNNAALYFGVQENAGPVYVNFADGIIDEVRICSGAIQTPTVVTAIAETNITSVAAKRIMKWSLGENFPTTVTTVELHNMLHFDALHEVGKTCQCDVWFDNTRFKVFMGVKGKVVNDLLDIKIQVTPEVSLDYYGNIINLLGKNLGSGRQLDGSSSASTNLKYNYEKVIADSRLTTEEQIAGVGTGLLNEFKELTPSIKGVVPFDQFRRFDLQSGDQLIIADAPTNTFGTFRIIELKVTPTIVECVLETVGTGSVRARGLSLRDVLSKIIDKVNDSNIVS